MSKYKNTEHDNVEAIASVYPTETKSVFVEKGDEPCYKYTLSHMIGLNNGKAVYGESSTELNFVKKIDGGFKDGLQNEQLVEVVLHRTKELNKLHPNDFNTEMIQGLEMYLNACRKRINDRINRGVFGERKD